MDMLKTWLKSSSPTVKVLMAISITSGIVVINRLYYAPYSQRKRYLEAEEWANIVLEKENALKESTETR